MILHLTTQNFSKLFPLNRECILYFVLCGSETVHHETSKNAIFVAFATPDHGLKVFKSSYLGKLGHI